MENFVVWFDIPVKDMKRAMNFYSKVMGIKLESRDTGTVKMAFFPSERGAVSGALVESNERKPSRDGVVVYLNGGKDLSAPLKRVTAAGGKIVKEKTSIGEHGFFAVFEDTEGNHVALHSME